MRLPMIGTSAAGDANALRRQRRPWSRLEHGRAARPTQDGTFGPAPLPPLRHQPLGGPLAGMRVKLMPHPGRLRHQTREDRAALPLRRSEAAARRGPATMPLNGPTLKLLRRSADTAVLRPLAAAATGLTGAPLYGTRSVGRPTAPASLLAGAATPACHLDPLVTGGTATSDAPFTQLPLASSVGRRALSWSSDHSDHSGARSHGTIVLPATPMSTDRTLAVFCSPAGRQAQLSAPLLPRSATSWTELASFPDAAPHCSFSSRSPAAL